MSGTEIKKSNMTDKDRGWAWAVCAATMLYNITMAGTLKSQGFIFLIFKERFDEDNTTTALIGTIFTLAVALFGPLAGSILNSRSHTGLRLTILVSAVVMTSGIVASAWCHTAVQAIVTFGLISGLAGAAIDPSTLSFLGIYFEKRRVLGCSISFAGGSLGGLVVPPLLTWAHDANGPRAAIMMLAGVWLHMFLVGATCRPLKQQIKTDEKQFNLDGGVRGTAHDCELKTISATVEKTQASKQAADAKCRPFNQDNFSSSSVSIDQTSSQINLTRKVDTDKSSLLGKLHVCGRHLNAYRKFLASPGLLLLIATLAVAAFAHFTNFILFPPLMEELYLGKELASRVIMISAVCDTISRPIFGIIGEKLGNNKVFLIHSSFILTVAAGVYAVLTLSSLSFYVYGVILGIFGGMYVPFIVPLILESTTNEHVASGTGLFPFIVGFGPAVGLYVIAALKDRTGTYRNSLVLLLSAFVLAFIMITIWTINWVWRTKPKKYVWKL